MLALLCYGMESAIYKLKMKIHKMMYYFRIYTIYIFQQRWPSDIYLSNNSYFFVNQVLLKIGFQDNFCQKWAKICECKKCHNSNSFRSIGIKIGDIGGTREINNHCDFGAIWCKTVGVMCENLRIVKTS